MKKISIIVPIYNVEQYLAKCLESIVAQTHDHIEVILVNDGSTDRSPEIAEKYASKNGRIKVIHKANGGLSDARNAGYELVTGDYLAFVDSDDMIAVDFCEKLLRVAIDYNADIVECDFVKFKKEKELNHLHFENKVEAMDAETALEYLMKDKLKQVVWNKLYRTEVVNGLLFEKGKIHEDEFWTYQILGNAENIVKTTNILYFYRQQNESIMAENYNLKRLYGLEAREWRMHYVLQNFPNLSNLAVQTFWHSAFNNYQAIVRTSGIDPDSKHRKRILRKIGENVSKEYFSTWSVKDIFWLKFFLAAPELCSKLRNFVGVGV